MKCIVVDYDECRGCNCCTLACSFFNTKTFNSTKANLSIASFPEVDLRFPVVCQQCLQPVCMEVCPALAIYRDDETGAMIIDQKLCIGCKMCIMACPVGSPWVDSDNFRVMKCDLCGGDPKCVSYCGYGALQFIPVEEATMKQRKEGARKIADILKKLN